MWWGNSKAIERLATRVASALGELAILIHRADHHEAVVAGLRAELHDSFVRQEELAELLGYVYESPGRRGRYVKVPPTTVQVK